MQGGRIFSSMGNIYIRVQSIYLAETKLSVANDEQRWGALMMPSLRALPFVWLSNVFPTKYNDIWRCWRFPFVSWEDFLWFGFPTWNLRNQLILCSHSETLKANKEGRCGNKPRSCYRYRYTSLFVYYYRPPNTRTTNKIQNKKIDVILCCSTVRSTNSLMSRTFCYESDIVILRRHGTSQAGSVPFVPAIIGYYSLPSQYLKHGFTIDCYLSMGYFWQAIDWGFAR